MLFGIPDHKDEIGSGAYAQDGIVQKALRSAKERYPEMYYVTDVCMCEYTSHGHCGVLCGHDVDNDKTLELLAKTALSHVEAGADMVAPTAPPAGRPAAPRQPPPRGSQAQPHLSQHLPPFTPRLSLRERWHCASNDGEGEDAFLFNSLSAAVWLSAALCAGGGRAAA